MPIGVRQIPDAVALALVVWAHWRLSGWWIESEWARRRRVVRWLGLAWRWVGVVWVTYGIVFGIGQIARFLPNSDLREWVRGAAILYGMCVVAAGVLHAMIHRVPGFDPERRRLLHAARASAVALPVAACGYGVFLERNEFQMREVDLPVPGLPKDLDGLRLAQITDIHYSAYLGDRELERAIAMANETRPHVALLTGDFISVRRDPLDRCLRLLPRLRAEAGVYGCLGNHEILAGCEDYLEAAAAKLGITILRGSARGLRFGAARLNLAGVDYQRTYLPYLRESAGLVEKDAVNVLLSHNPDVFPVAARQGWQATISGHTHGGQVNFELLGEQVNVARFFTPYVYGLYREGGSSIYVSRGLGTVGAPIRLGAPPEVNLIRLCAISS